MVTTKVADMNNLLYTMAMSSDILINDIEWRLKPFKAMVKQDTKRAFGMYSKCLKDADTWYERSISPVIDATSFGDYNKVERRRQRANEYIQLLMLFIDRCYTQEAFEKVFQTLRSLPSAGIFDESDLDRFHFKAKPINLNK